MSVEESAASRTDGEPPPGPDAAVEVFSGGGHGRHPLRRTRADRRHVLRQIRELLLVPALVILFFVVLTVLAIVADQTQAVPALDPLRAAVASLIGKDASKTILQAVATGMVTVTSITLSVLLLAVQQTASNLSPVVFDHFLRRRQNQAFVGFFVGLILYAYVVEAAVSNSMPPILGAALAVLLTILAMAILLVLVWSTIAQMRPTNVLRRIKQRILQARDHELPLLQSTQRDSCSPHPERATVRASASGYVTALDVDLLRDALGDSRAELILHVTLGQYTSYGDLLATVRDDTDEHARHIADAVERALVLAGDRNSSDDATTGIDQIGNIAWTSASTAKHNPEIAMEALAQLKDVAARWCDDARRGRAAERDPLPIVYPDQDLDRVLDMLYSVLVATHESHQHHTAAQVVQTHADLLCLAPDHVRDHLVDNIRRARPLLDQLPPSRPLDQAREQFWQEAARFGHPR